MSQDGLERIICIITEITFERRSFDMIANYMSSKSLFPLNSDITHWTFVIFGVGCFMHFTMKSHASFVESPVRAFRTLIWNGFFYGYYTIIAFLLVNKVFVKFLILF
uniref:Uncharacterized protein n=1 Tax=Lepeophtheirus salmonis TaxID=72036 RepID=A0A0K2TGR2_LEPSM